MKRFLFLALIFLWPTPAQVFAQAPEVLDAPSGHKSLAATLDIYDSPSAGQEASQQAQQVDNLKKAFGVCLEAKMYMVKY